MTRSTVAGAIVFAFGFKILGHYQKKIFPTCSRFNVVHTKLPQNPIDQIRMTDEES